MPHEQLELYSTVHRPAVWFTFEFLARLLASPKRLAFLLSPMNAIDLAAIVPFYVALVMTHILDDIKLSVRPSAHYKILLYSMSRAFKSHDETYIVSVSI